MSSWSPETVFSIISPPYTFPCLGAFTPCCVYEIPTCKKCSRPGRTHNYNWILRDPTCTTCCHDLVITTWCERGIFTRFVTCLTTVLCSLRSVSSWADSKCVTSVGALRNPGLKTLKSTQRLHGSKGHYDWLAYSNCSRVIQPFVLCIHCSCFQWGCFKCVCPF